MMVIQNGQPVRTNLYYNSVIIRETVSVCDIGVYTPEIRDFFLWLESAV